MDFEISPGDSIIKELPKSTVRLIGSSQVITSVVSVVKELVENSLDAGAASIDIKLDNFGFDKIEIRDNGHGVEQKDVAYMGQPHYTSKISDISDLQAVQTYGFRGEALGSLCCVSNVTITTMTKNDSHSTSYTLNQHGQVVSSKPSHLTQGTTVTATNLFKNLPVRRQFYGTAKKKKDEMKRVEDFVISCGVANPGVRFCLRHEKNIVWQKNPGADVKSVLISVFGNYVLLQMEHVTKSFEDPQVTIEAFLPKPAVRSQLVMRHTSDRCFVFVNKRTVTLKEVEKLLRRYCCAAFSVEGSKYPMAYVHFTMATQDVDVNLDPNKTKVLLHSKDKVLRHLEMILEEIYGSQDKENQNSTGSSQADTDKMLSSQDSISSLEHSAKTEILKSRQDLVCDNDDTVACKKSADINVNVQPPVLNALTVIDTGSQKVSLDADKVIDSSYEPTKPLGSKENHTSCTVEESTLDEMTHDLLKDLEEHDDLSLFDISTPKLVKPADFDPMCSSTQVPNVKSSKASPELSSAPSSAANHLASGSVMMSFDDTHGPSAGEMDTSSKVMEESCASSLPGAVLKYAVEPNGTSDASTISEQVSVDQDTWAKGTALRDADNKTVNPVELHTLTLKQAPPTTPRLQRSDSTGSTGVKKRIVSGIHNVSIEKFLANNKTVQKTKAVAVRVRSMKDTKFSITDLKKRYSSSSSVSGLEGIKTRTHLIGHLKSHGAWVCCHGDQMALFQPIRAQEQILYERLMANHRFQPQDLDLPIKLDTGILGDAALWNTLLMLRRSEPVLVDPYTYFTDSRLGHNGFKIRHRFDNTQPVVELAAVPECAKFDGVKALCEVLHAVSGHSDMSLSDSRPSRVKHFLQGEAVRMSRHLSGNIGYEDVKGILADVQSWVNTGKTSCFHGKPFYIQFYNLSDIPLSQDSCFSQEEY